MALETKCQENARAIAQQMKNSGGSGSDVTVTQVLTSGTKIATIKVDDDSTDLYCETVPATPEADDIAYDNTDSGLTATNVQDAIDEIAQGGSGGTGSYSLIWTNPDLTAGIDSTTPISITGADTYSTFVFEIIANSNYADKGIMTTVGNLGSTPNQVGVFGNSNNLPAYFYRTFTTTSTSLILSAPYKKELGGWSDTSDVNTNYIPVKIYGLK